MRNLVLFAFCILMLSFTAQSQDNMDGSLGLPGDNLNLYAVMKLFQESKTLELFERNLNDENSRINNLDLNGDGKIDYISVIDNFDGKVHTIVLRDAISPTESQDVAVFYVGKDNNNHLQIQLIGDEALYGKDYIIEPNIGANAVAGHTINPGYTGNREVVVEEPVVMEVNAWPLLGLLFLPTYVVWHSPYYYGYYPNYWRPWQPLYWHSYYGYHSNMNFYYEGNFRRTVQYRDTHFHEHYYSGRRNFAPTVIQHRNEGFYKKTYSHPELRREGAAQFNKLHPGFSNRPNNRPEVQRNLNNGNRPIGNRPSNNQFNNRPLNRPTPALNARPAVNRNNVNPATRPAASPARPSVNQGNARTPASRPAATESRPAINQNNARTFARPAATPQQYRPGNNRVQPSGNQGQTRQRANPAPVRQPAPKAASRPNNPPPKKENNAR